MAQYDLTVMQERALGRIVADNFGANMQTGMDEESGFPYVYTKAGPNHPATKWLVAPQGEVTADGVEWDGQSHGT